MDDGSCFARERGTSRFPTPPGFFRLSCLLLGSIRQEQRQARRVAFWESALVIHQLLGTVHSDLLQLIVDRVQPPPPRARKTFPTPYSPPLLELRCASRVPPA